MESIALIVVVLDFNTSLSEMDRSSRQKIIKDIIEINKTINQQEIIDYLSNSYRSLQTTLSSCGRHI